MAIVDVVTDRGKDQPGPQGGFESIGVAKGTENMWGTKLLDPPPGLEKYQAELNERHPHLKGHHFVVGINPKDDSASALMDEKNGYGNYIPRGWQIGTNATKDKKIIVVTIVKHIK